MIEPVYVSVLQMWLLSSSA